MVAPVAEQDLEWLQREATKPELLASFGLSPGDDRLARAVRDRNVQAGVIFGEGQKRVGFTYLYPPREGDAFWEYIAAIPDVADRDGFTALDAFDAMAFYAFDWMKVARLGFRIEDRNTAALAIVQRLGFARQRTEEVEGKTMHVYAVDRAAWGARLAKLERREATHPSGLGATFLQVGAPYLMRQLSRAPGAPIRA